MSYKLIYFNGKGRAELSRLCFAAAGVKYEDKRIKPEEWAKLKPSTPTGAVPILEVEGEMIPQSLAIVRFLARKFKLMGTTDMEETKINVVLDTILDLREALAQRFYEKDEARKATLGTKLKEQTIPNTLKCLEAMIAANKCKDGFIVGKSLSVADLAIYDGLETLVATQADVLDSFKCVKTLREKVAALPRISKYLKERPKTEF